ncbi:MAG: protein TonB [Paraglaciecola sp.]|jgi:protein TonB
MFRRPYTMPMFSACEDVENVNKRSECSNGKLLKFIEENLIYPCELDTSGMVVLRFVVEKDGTLTDIKVVRNIGYGCGEVALEMVEKMPKWNPGTSCYVPVRNQYNLPVKFKL